MIKKHLSETRQIQKQKAEKIRVVSSLKEALSQIDLLEAQISAIKALESNRSVVEIRPRFSSNKSEAVAIAVATDWHVGSVVKPETVSGLNKYDVSIAKARATRFFQAVVSLTTKERQDVSISELILFLGGDLIDGALHLDTVMSNEIATPIEQSIVVQEMIESGINFLLNHGKYKKITVVCCDGNHGRITNKLHFNSRKGNALEYFLYYNLAKRFPNLNWVIADGLHAYVDVYDKVMRFHHGDTISFGGVNGPYTYLNRRIYQWNEGHRADYSVQGHLHTYTLGTRKWLINGSLVGYSPFGLGLGGEFQPPIQAFFLMDKKRGVTVHIPILV